MIELNGILKKYSKGSEVFTALSGITFKLEKGDFCSVIGASGSGKSTLLNIIGGLIRPDSGTVLFNGNDLFKFRTRDVNAYRKKSLGFMFQQFHLMPYLTVAENIRLACYEKKHLKDIDPYLEKCAIGALKNKYPSELSVGEKQRAAFIRAIISRPELLLADEPTGNLDRENSDMLLSLVREYNRQQGTVILVSHDPAMSAYSNRCIRLDRGLMASA